MLLGSEKMASGSESNHSPCKKRNRDHEDAVYLDNLHAHKRYLSEIMASSLNGLTVGDSLSENHRTSPSRFDPMESPARSENSYSREEFSSQYSPMSEDSDDSRYCDPSSNVSAAQSDTSGIPTSPCSSPQRYSRQHLGFPSSQPTNPSPLPCCSLSTMACSPSRQRGSDSDSRFPPSPSDICHPADLRRAALLRSVQMRAQPQSFELQYSMGQEAMQQIDESENRECLCVKSLSDETRYSSSSRVRSLLLEDCSPSLGMSEAPERSQDKCYRGMNLSIKGDGGGGRVSEVVEEGFGGNGLGRRGLISSSSRSVLGGHTKPADVAFKWNQNKR